MTSTAKKKDAFVKVPLWFASEAAKSTNTLKALVWIHLLHASWKAKSLTFPLPNGRLERIGVSRETKRRALRDLERAGLITVERLSRKSPVVTIVTL